jgi:imidazoleglycerol-phosphate dehydratase
MAAAGRSGIRLDLHGSGAASVDTGLAVLDALLERLAHYARWNLALEVEPGTGEAEVAEAGRAVGDALADGLRDGRGYGFATMTSAEALASVSLEVSEQPLVVTNVDLSGARIGGLGTDVARRFLDRFAEGAGVTLHVRLLNGTDTQHVLEAIFKALGVALAQACASEGGSE